MAKVTNVEQTELTDDVVDVSDGRSNDLVAVQIYLLTDISMNNLRIASSLEFVFLDVQFVREELNLEGQALSES